MTSERLIQRHTDVGSDLCHCKLCSSNYKQKPSSQTNSSLQTSESVCKSCDSSLVGTGISVVHACQMCGTLFKKRNEFDKHVEQCNEFDSQSGKTEYTPHIVTDLSFAHGLHKTSKKLTMIDNKKAVEAADVIVSTGVDKPTVIEELNKPISSKRKRKLKDFSDYETDFGMKIKMFDGNIDQHTLNKDKHSKDFKSDKIKHTETDNARTCHKKLKPKIDKNAEKRGQNIDCVGTNKQSDVDKLETVMKTNNEMQEFVDSNIDNGNEDSDKCAGSTDLAKQEVVEHLDKIECGHFKDRYCDKEIAIQEKRVIIGKSSQSGLKESSCFPNIKIMSARIVAHQESSDAHHENLGKAETKTMLAGGMTVQRNVETTDYMEIKSAGDISRREIKIIGSLSNVNGQCESNTAVVPLSEPHKESKKSKNAEIDHDGASGENGQEAEMRNWFNFSNLKQAVYKCVYENCTFSSVMHTEWLYHYRRMHQKTLNKHTMAYCLKCNYSPQEKRLLKEHLLVKHNDSPTSPVGYKYCRILHKNSGHEMKILACIFCGFVMDSVNISRGHNCKRLKFYFYCPWCDAKAMQFETMNSHIQSSHSDKRIFGKEVSSKHKNVRTSEKDPASRIGDHEVSCKECQVEFNNNNDLKLHVNNEHAIFPFGCGVCRLCYVRMSGVRDHMKKVHLLAHQCNHCERRFGCRTDLTRHESTHAVVRPVKCDFCNKRYADKGALLTHIGIKHPAEWNDGKYSGGDDRPNSYMCHLCGEHLKTSKQFQKHWQMNHANKDGEKINLLYCKLCLQSFTTRRKYNFHGCVENSNVLERETVAPDLESLKEMVKRAGMKTSSEIGKKTKCSFCNKLFGNRKCLQQHLFSVHLNENEKNFPCNVCERRFWKKSELRAHLRIHNNCKPYHCKVCSKTFRQLGHVKEHLLSHASNSKFPCPLCSLAFKTKPSCRRHVFGHCRMFPFECPVRTCSSKSATISLLIAHLRYCADISQEDYLCKICDKNLFDVKSAVTHMKSHEKDELYLCVTCNESFSSSISLCWHKINSDHFTDEERREATLNQKKTQNFKCKEIDSDISLGDLVKRYEYVNQHDLEAVHGEISEGGVGINEVEEHIVEQNDIIYMDNQPTHLKEENHEINAIIGNDIDHQFSCQLPPFVETVEVPQTEEHDHMFDKDDKREIFTVTTSSCADTTKNTYMCHDEEAGAEIHQPNNLSLVEIPVSSDLITCGNSNDGSNSMVVLNCDNYREPENVIIGAVSDGNWQIASENIGDSTKSCLYPDSVKDESLICVADEERTNLIPSEEKTLRLDENMLAVLKILDENGDEVFMFTQEGFPIPIQGNPDILQTVLSTGKYSIQLASSNTELSQEIGVNEETLQDTVVIDGQMLEVSKHTDEQVNSINGELVHEIVTDSGIGDFICETNDNSDNVKLVENLPKKGHQDSTTAGLMKNVDKIKGILTDTDAESTNKKMENGSTNYKVRLCYYEDRSKNADKYPLKCEVCDKRYKRKKDLNLHKKVHLSHNERPYQCEECGKGFTTRHAYRNHQRTHTGDRPFSCTQCDKVFRQLGHLQTHLRSHADYRPFQCALCKKSFLTNSLLKGHMKQNHEGGEFSSDNNMLEFENNKCDICAKSLRSLEELRIHRIKHLSNEQESDLLRIFSDVKNIGKDDVISSRSGPKTPIGKFKMCDICGKIVSNLNRHKMLHETGSTVTCRHCQKDFSTNSLLLSHLQKYHPEESFQCDTCGIKLNNRNALNSHLKIHKRPSYSCLHCKKTYVTKKLLFGHLIACVGEDFIPKFDACFL